MQNISSFEDKRFPGTNLKNHETMKNDATLEKLMKANSICFNTFHLQISRANCLRYS